MKNLNKKRGNRFETEFAEILGRNGFWAHVFQQNKDGQPADIIAVKDCIAILIDCKLCESNDTFRFERIEPNQRMAMTYFISKTNGSCFFALKRPDGEIRMLDYRKAAALERAGKTGVTAKDIGLYTVELNHWLDGKWL